MKRAVLLGTIAALAVAVAVTAAGGRGVLFQAIFHAGGTGATDRSAFSKLSDVVNVKDFGALCDGTTDDSAAFSAAAAASLRVYIPQGTCSLGTTGFAFLLGTHLIGSGSQTTILSYSGTGCALTMDSVQNWRASGLKVLTSSSNSGLRGACILGTGSVSNIFGTMEDVYFIQNNATHRNAGQIGMKLDATGGQGVQWNRFLGVQFNYWDTSVELDGNGSNQPNSNTFDVVSAAANTPFYIQRGNDNDIRVKCTTSDATLIAGTQVCITVGDGAVLSAGNMIRVFSDQGATGKSYVIASGAQNNWLWSDNESTTAGTDANATSTATNFRFEMKPSAQPTMNFGNLTFTASSTPTVAGTPSGATSPLIIRGAVANGATAVAVRISGNATLSTAGALIADFNNGGVKSGVDLNGAYVQAGVTFANLATGTVTNGTMLFCTNCDPATNPCTAAGAQTGSFALRMNGAWKCM